MNKTRGGASKHGQDATPAATARPHTPTHARTRLHGLLPAQCRSPLFPTPTALWNHSNPQPRHYNAVHTNRRALALGIHTTYIYIYIYIARGLHIYIYIFGLQKQCVGAHHPTQVRLSDYSPYIHHPITSTLARQSTLGYSNRDIV